LVPKHEYLGEEEAEVVFQPDGMRIKIRPTTKITDAVRDAGLDIQFPCADLGLCGRCRIILNDSQIVTDPTENELRTISTRDLEAGYRLACQCSISKPGSIVITVPAESRVSHQKTVIHGFTPPFKVSAKVSKVTVRIDRVNSSKSVIADSELLLNALKVKGYKNVSLSLDSMRLLPNLLHSNSNIITAIIWGRNTVLTLESGDRHDRLFGLALDIGTTKLAGYLVNLLTGRLLASASLSNPQIAFGEDLISRVTYWSEHGDNGRRLQESVINGVNKIIANVCKESKVSQNEISDVTVAGNTVMHHIFFGISPERVAQTPFPLAVKKSFDVKSESIKMNVNPSVYVHAIPPIAGFVGSDTVAGILATEMYKSAETSMLIDIGTNAEIVVAHNRQLTCCSSPAGPAFEGGRIKHGMRSSNGAIESVWIDSEDYNVGYRTVNDAKPIGICGSGLIDAVAQMLKAGIIGRNGRFDITKKTDRLRTYDGKTEFVLAWRNDSGTPDDITLTSQDIQEVLLAKAAIYAGASVILNRLKVKPEDIKQLYVAGSFGTYVDVTSSLLIGMYPEIQYGHVRFVGNSSGSGARMVLLSDKLRRTADKIAESTCHIELSTDSLFESEYTKALWMPHREDKRFPNIMKMLGKH